MQKRARTESMLYCETDCKQCRHCILRYFQLKLHVTKMASGVWDPRSTFKIQSQDWCYKLSPAHSNRFLAALLLSRSPAQAVTALHVTLTDVVHRAIPFSAFSNVSEVLLHLPLQSQCLSCCARLSFSQCESHQHPHVLEATT